MKNTILLLLVLIISGCTSMQTVSSIDKSVEVLSNYKYYDSGSKIRYQVSNNENYLFLTFNTTNKASIMKIIRTGLTIYVDTNGKKKKDTYIQYPLAKLAKLEKGKIASGQQTKTPEMNLSNMISGVPREAVYFTNNSKHAINLSTDTSGLEIILKEENGGFTYRIKIPFTTISNSGYKSLLNLVIGVESGEFEMPSQRSSQSSGMQSGPGGKGGGGGHGSSGMGKGGQGGASQSQYLEMTVPIKFWFRVNLAF